MTSPADGSRRRHGRRGDADHDLKQGDARKSSAVWWDYVEFGLLLREADALVLDTDFPADPFARFELHSPAAASPFD